MEVTYSAISGGCHDVAESLPGRNPPRGICEHPPWTLVVPVERRFRGSLRDPDGGGCPFRRQVQRRRLPSARVASRAGL